MLVRTLALLAGIVSTGTLLVLALPLGEQAYLAWFCFAPLLLATRDRGFLAGCLCAIGTLGFANLLAVAGPFYVHRDPHGDPAMVVAGFGQFGVSLGATVAIWSDPTLNRKPAWWFAAFATLLEAALLLTLPANIALTQYRQSIPLLAASVGGVWLVSFLIYWSNFALALMPPKRAVTGATALAALSLALSVIHFRPSGHVQAFAAIQVADPDEERLSSLQREASIGRPSLVVWPELSGAAFASGNDDRRLLNLSAQSGIAPIVTSFEDAWKPLPHNVSALFAASHESARYAKRKMFGTEGSLHAPGSLPVAVPYSGGQAGLAICFDSCYPEVIRDVSRLPGVNVIALPAIDPFASNHFIAAMHAAYSPFRCAEEGMALVRSDGRAYSQIVAPLGEIVAELPPGDGILNGTVSTATYWTPYKQFGDWFLAVCGILLVAGWLRSRRATIPSHADAETFDPARDSATGATQQAHA